MSEAILAASACRTSVTETVQSVSGNLPGPGLWGLRIEDRYPGVEYVNAIQTNSVGEIRVVVTGINTVPMAWRSS